MTTEIQNATDTYQVTFSPTDKQVGEIEKWLIAERKKTGDGFYCNWNIIKSSYKKNELATISYKNKTIGFATWWIATDKTASIDIAEVKPTHRGKGIGKILINKVLNYLRQKGICVAYLHCSPRSSEPIWKCLGFEEFPEPTENYNFNSSGDKQLYKILIEYLPINSSQQASETIELWNDEPYTTDEDTPPTYIWNLEFVEGTRKLAKPIIHPAHYDWRLRWRINDKIIKDIKVKRFGKEIDFGTFIIIDELTL